MINVSVSVTLTSTQEVMSFYEWVAKVEDARNGRKPETASKVPCEEAPVTEVTKVTKPVDPQPTKVEPQQASVSDPEPKQDKKVTLTAVRTKALSLTRAGKKEQVQEAIKSFGVDKLPEVPADQLPALAEKLEAIDAT